MRKIQTGPDRAECTKQINATGRVKTEVRRTVVHVRERLKDQDENLLTGELWTAVGVVTPPLYTEEGTGVSRRNG